MTWLGAASWTWAPVTASRWLPLPSTACSRAVWRCVGIPVAHLSPGYARTGNSARWGCVVADVCLTLGGYCWCWVVPQLNPWLVAISKWSAWRQGVSAHTSFACGNLFAADVSDCDVIMVFGVKPLMHR